MSEKSKTLLDNLPPYGVLSCKDKVIPPAALRVCELRYLTFA